MKKLSLIATALVASTLAAGASAATISTTSLTAVSTTSPTAWTGISGTVYEAYTALNADQQAVELKGTIDPKLANTSLPNTVIKLPALTPYTPATTYGYGDTVTTTSTRMSEACFTTATPIGGFSKSWSKSQTLGNSYLGGGYTASFILAGTAGTGATDKLSADGYAKINGTAFGNVGSIEGKAFAQLQGTAITHNLYLKRNGVTVWTPGTTTGVLSFTKAYSGNVATGNKTIWLGPIPVNFSASANASYGINGSLSYANAKLTASATPYANLSTAMAASVNVYVASFGVSGGATFNASLPLVAGLGVNAANQYTYDVDFDVTLSGSGNVNGSATLHYLFGSKTWTSNLVSYSYSSTFPIVDLHGCGGNFL